MILLIMRAHNIPSWLSQQWPQAIPTFQRVLYFGALTNLLALTPSVYMLEVYGRVVSSRSHMTLAMLTLLVIAAYLWLEALEWVRSDMLHQASVKLDTLVAPQVFDAMFQSHLRRTRGGAASGTQDVAVLRSFMTSPAMLALLDAPYALMVMLILFAINPWLGLASVCVACVVMGVGWLTDRATRTPLQEAHRTSSVAQNFAAGAMRQTDVMAAMGMQHDVYALWKEKQDAFLLAQAVASDHAGVGAATSKFIQTLQSSLMLGLGCWLTLKGSLDPSGGMMIMGSILGGRALAPITQVIGQWRQVAQARAALTRLDKFLGPALPEQPAMPLPAPTGALAVQALTVQAPGTQHALLRGIQFTLNPGEMLAVLGPSGAGKTCLSRALVGVWPAAAGKVRLDGVDVFTWNKTELGPFVGYLPQDIELFDGTLAENITRFGTPDMLQLQAAALAVGLDQYIASLPLGFETPVGLDGGQLSGGVRQRVGLARALYGNPVLVVLDEPNASLDEAGDEALLQAITHTKQRGASVVLVTHRPQILGLADKLLILREGQMQAFGPRDQVMEALQQAMAKARASGVGA
jgi:ATP-binding cassette subfamily C exporter for protease/lipase